MELPPLIPELKVFNYIESLDFYTRLAGFEIIYDRPEEEFAMLRLGQARLMIEGFTPKGRSWIVGKLEKPLGRGMHLQIEVQDVSSLYETFKKGGYPIFFDLEEKCYRVKNEEICQRQFLVQDPDGYLLRFVERI